MSNFSRTDIKRFFSEVMYESLGDPITRPTISAKGIAQAPDGSGMPPVGGGLGRGLVQAKANLKRCLEDIYQEVVDAITDEYDPDGEGVMADETMGMAAEETAQEINSVVKDFYEGIGALGHSRHGDFYKSKSDSDYSDEYKAMGRSGRFYDK